MIRVSTTQQEGCPTIYTAWDGKKCVEVTEAEFNALPDGIIGQEEISADEKPNAPKDKKDKKK